MTPAQAFAALRRLKPEAALAFLRERGQITQTWSWADLRAEEHALQFTVSRLASVDLLAQLRDLIIDSVAGDLTRRDFMRDARAALARKGWWGTSEVEDPATGETVRTTFNPTRLKLIYDTNVRQAAVAGQWDRAQETKRAFPYLRYVTLADEKVRESHAQWHNLVLPVDDPFWNAHMPQNAYRCRCYVRQVSAREYQRGTTPTGQRMDKTAPPERLQTWTNPRTGEDLQVPQGVHPAFVGNPGRDRAATLQRASADKLAALPPGLAPAARALLQRPVPPPIDHAANDGADA
jgi:SPP1 gp7 family putative phage head morphogenesis protein